MYSNNYISKLSLLKVRNFIRLYYNYRLSNFQKKVFLNAMPTSVAIEPTTSCNLHCPECPTGLRALKRSKGNMELSFFNNIIEQIKETTTSLVLYFQGEPYLLNNFTDLVYSASKAGIYTFTSTNAHFLTTENCRNTVLSGLDKLIVSFDGTTQNVYENYRQNGNLQTVVSGIEEIVKWKKKLHSKTPFVYLQFLVVKHNEHQIAELKAIAKKLGVDGVLLKTAQLNDFKNGNALMPTIEKYSRYKKNSDGTYSLKNKLENKCWRLWSSTVITFDGKMLPCCFDKDAQFAVGSLKENSFRELWFGKEMNNFRQRILLNRKNIPICTNCTEGLSVFA